jgi:hypothetical protein
LPRAGAEAWLELHIKNSSGGATKIVQALAGRILKVSQTDSKDRLSQMPSIGSAPAGFGGRQ